MTSPAQTSLTGYDLAIVGSGILGLAHAYLAAKAGLKVCVIERNARPIGASIRNFGFITVTGQQRGEFYHLARKTRDVWAEVAPQAGIAIHHRGLMMAVRRPESEAVLEAFLKTEMGEGCRLLRPADTGVAFTGAVTTILHSPHEVRVESRHAIPQLAAFLREVHGVVFKSGVGVTYVESGRLETSMGEVCADRVIVCPGDDLNGLFADRIAARQVSRCQLQMMRLADPGFRLPAAVMSDLGLVRYLGYAELPEAGALKARLMAEQGTHIEHGVHLIVVQSADGSLVVGDSHHYGDAPEPFASVHVDHLILNEYAAVLGAPPLVLERWTGTYATSAQQLYFIDEPAHDVRLVVVTCGAGASSSFGIAEKVLKSLGIAA